MGLTPLRARCLQNPSGSGLLALGRAGVFLGRRSRCSLGVFFEGQLSGFSRARRRILKKGALAAAWGRFSHGRCFSTEPLGRSWGPRSTNFQYFCNNPHQNSHSRSGFAGIGGKIPERQPHFCENLRPGRTCWASRVLPPMLLEGLVRGVFQHGARARARFGHLRRVSGGSAGAYWKS